MWPSQRKVGAQLTHGIETPGLYRETHDPDKPWAFANELDDPLELSPVEMSETILKHPSPQFSSQNSDQRSQVYVPAEITRELTREAQLYTDGVYDPAVANRLAIGYLNVSRGRRMILVNVRNRTEVHLSLLLWAERAVIHEETKQVAPMSVPWAAKSVKVEFPEECVHVALQEPLDGSGTRNCIVVTRHSLTLLNVRRTGYLTSNEQLVVTKYGEWSAREMGDSDLVHASVNPFNHTEVAVINARGDFRILNTQSRQQKVPFVPKIFSNCSIYDPIVPSKFKRIFWGFTADQLIVMSRSRIYTFNTTTGKLKEVVTAMAWSTLLDMKRLPLNPEHFVLLTSKELIVVDLSSGAKKILAFKHCLNDADPSMSLAVTELPDTGTMEHVFLCSVSSLTTRLVWSLKIALDAESVVAVGQPFMISLTKTVTDMAMLAYKIEDEDELKANLRSLYSSDGSIKQFTQNVDRWREYILQTNSRMTEPISLPSESVALSVFSLSEDDALTTSSWLSKCGYKSLPASRNWLTCSPELVDEMQAELEGDDDDEENVPVASDKALVLCELLLEPRDSWKDRDEIDKIQELATDFSSRLNKILKSDVYGSVLTLFDAIEHKDFIIEDTDELNEMIEQFFEQFEGRLAVFRKVTADSLKRLWLEGNTANHVSLNDVKEALQQLKLHQRASAQLQSQIAHDMYLSLVCFSGMNKELVSKTSEIHATLPGRYQSILDRWGDSYEKQEETNVRLTQMADSQRIPTVKASQRPRVSSPLKQTPARSASSTHPMLSRPPQSQSQISISSSFSQKRSTQSKDKKKKKKRRVGGFM